MKEDAMETTYPRVYALGCTVPAHYAEYLKGLLKESTGQIVVRVKYQPYDRGKEEPEENAKLPGMALLDISGLPDDLKKVREGEMLSIASLKQEGFVWSDSFRFPEPEDGGILYHFHEWSRVKEWQEKTMSLLSSVLKDVRSGRADAPEKTLEIKRDNKPVVYEIGVEPSTGAEERQVEFMEKVLQPITGRKHVILPVGNMEKGKRRRLIVFPSYVAPGVGSRTDSRDPAASQQDESPLSVATVSGFVTENILKAFHVEKKYSLSDPFVANCADRENLVIDALMNLTKDVKRK
jgi:hypothetical protein